MSGVVLASPSGVGNPYFFTGRRFDSEMGLYYYRARYLDPVAGRFVNRDPIGMWGDAANVGNAYTYAASNPWTRTDPTGLSSGKARVDLSFVHNASGGSDSGRGGRRIGRGDGFLKPRGKVGISAPSSPYADLPKNDSSPSPLCSATSTAHSPPGGCNLPAVMVSDEQEGDGGSDGGASDPDHGGSDDPPDDDDNKASGPGEYKGPTGPPPPGGGARPYVPGPTRPWTGDPESEWQKTITIGTSGEGELPISRQKQDGHIRGTDEYKNRIKLGKDTSTWDDPEEADDLTREAWEKGEPVKGKPHQREFDVGRRVGPGPDGKPQTGVRAHKGKGRLHGHPAYPGSSAFRPGHAISGGEVATGVGLYLGYKAVRAVVVSFFATPIVGVGSLAIP